MSELQRTYNRGLASFVIFAVLTLQGTAVVGSVKKRLWPFTNYPMYSKAFAEGDLLHRYHVFAILDEGDVEILPKDLGLNFWKFELGLVRDLRRPHDDPRVAAKLAMYRRLYETRHDRRLTGFRLENHPVQILRTGMQILPPVAVSRVEFSSQEATH